MLFNTPEFVVFLVVVLGLYYTVNARYQNTLLLAASLFFYGYWDPRFVGLLLTSAGVDYVAGLRVAENRGTPSAKRWLVTSLAVNLGILGVFKYFNFFVDNAHRIFEGLGLSISTPLLTIILPVGISFYTFQSMSYTIDVYRGKMEPVRDLVAFVLYVSYFPQLVAGPIERATHLLPAITKRRVVDEAMLRSGLMLIVIGLFRKVVIADGIGQSVDLIFASPQTHSSAELLGGAYLFALQIYCDFAGYSDIARGTSRLLGIDLMINFEQPYFASSLREFWRRWHISLSTWLRDYLYIPLGGSRGGQVATIRNLMITMLLGGLWHGAAWSFVAWGLLHGSYLVVEHLLHSKTSGLRESLRIPAGVSRALGMVLTFHLVLLAWVFFRAPGFSAALDYLAGIAGGLGSLDALALLSAVAVPWLLVLAVDLPQRIAKSHTVFLDWPAWPRAAVASAMLFLVSLGFGTRAPFIYFQF